MPNLVRIDPVRSIAMASITGSYQPLGSSFDHAMRIVHFINNTNGDMMLSFDGTTDNIPLLAESFALYDFTSDEDINEKFRFQVGTQVFVKYLSAPTLPSDGAVYVVTVYGKGE